MLVLNAGSGSVVRAIAKELAEIPGPKRFLPATPFRGEPLAGFEHIAEGVASPSARGRALEGARELLILPTFDPRAADAQAALLREARQAGVGRVHFGSLIGADARSPVCLLRWVGLVEREVMASGLPHSVLRCAPFMQNVPIFARRDDVGLAVVGPFRDVGFPWLDAADIGAILAALVRSNGNGNVIAPLSGADEVDFQTIARLLGEALREPVRYVDVCLPEAQGMLEAKGFSPVQIRVLTEYWDYLVSGVIKPTCCDTARKLLGRPPRTIAEYFADHAGALRSTALPAPEGLTPATS